MKDKNINVTVNFSLLNAILLINIVLKMLGKITWSWGLVLWPLWAGLGVILFLIILYVLVKTVENL